MSECEEFPMNRPAGQELVGTSEHSLSEYSLQEP